MPEKGPTIVTEKGPQIDAVNKSPFLMVSSKDYLLNAGEGTAIK